MLVNCFPTSNLFGQDFGLSALSVVRFSSCIFRSRGSVFGLLKTRFVCCVVLVVVDFTDFPLYSVIAVFTLFISKLRFVERRPGGILGS